MQRGLDVIFCKIMGTRVMETLWFHKCDNHGLGHVDMLRSDLTVYLMDDQATGNHGNFLRVPAAD